MIPELDAIRRGPFTPGELDTATVDACRALKASGAPIPEDGLYIQLRGIRYAVRYSRADIERMLRITDRRPQRT